MMDRIILFSKIFFKSSFSFSGIQSAKLNIKGIIKWIIIFIVTFIGLLSYKILDLLLKINQPSIFLSILFLGLAFIVIIQTILICINLFYNSKDMEHILPLPIKPIELLISKFNVLLITIYVTEILFVAVPLIVYGISTHGRLFYYLYTLIILILYPILPAILSCIVVMLFMRLAKYFKNINNFQNLITIISTILILAINFINIKNINVENTVITDEVALKKILEANVISENIGKYFFTIKPTISALTNKNFFLGLLAIFVILLITLFFYFIFLTLGNKLYLKGILANLNKVKISKKHKNIKLKNYNKHNIFLRYIQKEYKLIFRNPIFFSQCVLPVFYIPILLIGIGFVVYKSISNVIGNIVDLDSIFSVNIDFKIICIFLGIIQISNFMSITAVTAFSRDGKNATIAKYLPISLYRQFIYKSIPALFLDMIPSIIIVTISYFILSKLTILYAFIIIFISLLINIIRIYLLQIIDLKRPKLNWDGEYMLVKTNFNIIISIALIGIIVLLLIYFAKAFSILSLTTSIISIIIIFFTIIIIINIFVKRNEKKLFSKII